MLNKSLIYFDNGATTFKPNAVIDSIVDYYSNYTANAHRGDYDISYEVDTKYEGVREKVREFINAEKSSEIIFTSGTTQSLNMIVSGYFNDYLKDGDEVLLTKAEHASNVLPWFRVNKKINIKYIELDNDLVKLDNVTKAITPNTKVISIAHVTNVIGDIRPIKEIIKYAHSKNILVVIDGAQSVPHMKVDVRDLDIDFLSFSAHKMCGPTGIGVLYGKYELLDKMEPQNVGGGMNVTFESDNTYKYKELPYKLEAGTPNIEGVIGLGSAIDYLNKIGMDNIKKYIFELRNYGIKELSKLDNIEIYNKDIESSTIVFNVKEVFSQDTASYLNKKGICVRAGNHCAKILKDEIGVTNTCRVSIYFYNTKEEIDLLVKALQEKDILKQSII
jgi:cysteine desulfurase/selenocysteine lyase